MKIGPENDDVTAIPHLWSDLNEPTLQFCKNLLKLMIEKPHRYPEDDVFEQLKERLSEPFDVLSQEIQRKLLMGILYIKHCYNAELLISGLDDVIKNNLIDDVNLVVFSFAVFFAAYSLVSVEDEPKKGLYQNFIETKPSLFFEYTSFVSWSVPSSSPADETVPSVSRLDFK